MTVSEQAVRIEKKDPPLTEAFRRDGPEDILHNREEECEDPLQQSAFEDQPRPVLTTVIRTTHMVLEKMEVLIDSGADLCLISEELFEKFPRKDQFEEDQGRSITTANGTKSRIKKYLKLKILIGSLWTSEVKVFSLRDLSEQLIIGNNALCVWKAEVSWKDKKIRTAGSEMSWWTRKQPHWRHPVTLTTDEDYLVPAGHSMVVGVQSVHCDQMWGRVGKEGLFTPVRTKLRYGFGELGRRVVLFNPGAKELLVRKGSQVAEFHHGFQATTIPLRTKRE